MSYPSIHDAFSAPVEIKPNPNTSQQQLATPPPPKPSDPDLDNGKYPSDASSSHYPLKIRCPKCRAVGFTRMSSQMGAASWVWCVLLSPFACVGISCLCLQSCRDKIHFCTRCGAVVGKKFAKVC